MTPAALPREFELIERLLAPLSRGFPGAYSLTDDAATVTHDADQALVVTQDLMVAGVHFRPDDDPALIARKLLRVNLSDLAAMGATPRAYLLGLALPSGTTAEWAESFVAGLAVDQKAFRICLVGGDTVATEGALTLSLTALGVVRRGCELRREGAEPGDPIFVSGSIGDGALGLIALEGGLARLEEESRARLIARYHLPEPRVALGGRLAGLAQAAIDVSDGLVADLGHLCAVSGVGAQIDLARVPLSPAARAALSDDPALVGAVLTGGDDYEILFCTRPTEAARVEALGAELGLALARIGTAVSGRGVRVIGPDGKLLELEREGYTHF